MKKIFCVSEDWANNYESHNTIKACFESKEDAIKYMNELWDKTKEDDEEWFSKFNDKYYSELLREEWIDGEWLDNHYCLEISETILY